MKTSYVLLALCFAILSIPHANASKVMLVLTDQEPNSTDTMTNPLYVGQDIINPLYQLDF